MQIIIKKNFTLPFATYKNVKPNKKHERES